MEEFPDRRRRLTDGDGSIVCFDSPTPLRPPSRPLSTNASSLPFLRSPFGTTPSRSSVPGEFLPYPQPAASRSPQLTRQPSPRVFPHPSPSSVIPSWAEGAAAYPFRKDNLPDSNNVPLRSALPTLLLLYSGYAFRRRYRQEASSATSKTTSTLFVFPASVLAVSSAFGDPAHATSKLDMIGSSTPRNSQAGPIRASARHEGRWEDGSRRCKRRRAMQTTYSIAGPPRGLRGRTCIHALPQSLLNPSPSSNQITGPTARNHEPSSYWESDLPAKRRLTAVFPTSTPRSPSVVVAIRTPPPKAGSATVQGSKYCAITAIHGALEVQPRAYQCAQWQRTIRPPPLPSFLNIQFHGWERSKTGDNGLRCGVAEEVVSRQGAPAVYSFPKRLSLKKSTGRRSMQHPRPSGGVRFLGRHVATKSHPRADPGLHSPNPYPPSRAYAKMCTMYIAFRRDAMDLMVSGSQRDRWKGWIKRRGWSRFIGLGFIPIGGKTPLLPLIRPRHPSSSLPFFEFLVFLGINTGDYGLFVVHSVPFLILYSPLYLRTDSIHSHVSVSYYPRPSFPILTPPSVHVSPLHGIFILAFTVESLRTLDDLFGCPDN
ncbi:hypothetical protein NMY22_g7550 [Coprinellus aureogranulatus]|nr:hypothetical protein NMY22_g7550 [Coprinellus aureogranulatus]